MTPNQSRAARALFGWKHEQLAHAAGVSLSVIKFFETGRRNPNSLAAIQRAIENAGIEFIPAKHGKGVGVRLVRD